LLQSNFFKISNRTGRDRYDPQQIRHPDTNAEINIPFPMHFVLDWKVKNVTKAQGIKRVEARLTHAFSVYFILPHRRGER
jgi:hypothetical protein